MKASFRSLSKPVHALLSCTNSIKHAFPTLLHLDPSLHIGRQNVSLCLCWPPKPLPNTETPPAPTKPKTYSHLTNSAVFSVPTRTAFAFAVLTSAMFVAAWVTRPLVTPSAHPAIVTAAGARNTNAMTTTVRCTNLCGRQRNRKGQKKRAGGRQKERKGGGGGGKWDGKGKTRRWWDKATRVKKRQIQNLLSRKGSHAPLPCLMAAEKKFLHLIRGNPFWQYKSNKSITKKRQGLWQP